MKKSFVPLIALFACLLVGLSVAGGARSFTQDDDREPTTAELLAKTDEAHGAKYIEALLKADASLPKAESKKAELEALADILKPYYHDKASLTPVEIDLIETLLVKSVNWSEQMTPRGDDQKRVVKNPHGLGEILVSSTGKVANVVVTRNGQKASVVELQSAGGLSATKRAAMVASRFREAQRNANWWVGTRLYISTQNGEYIIRSKDYTKDILVTASKKRAGSLSPKAYAESIRAKIRTVMGSLEK